MDPLFAAIFRDVPDLDHYLRVIVRLLVAALLGGVLGFERQREGKSAGIRTHMMVAMGAAVFTLIPLESGIEDKDLSRVIQGIATGIGFLGAGTILRPSEPEKGQVPGPHRVEGLTTAAGIWLTAAIGMTVGAGFLWPALVSLTLGWGILYLVHWAERWVKTHLRRKPPEDPQCG
jgi:putative Mg2+ transporter-C (MgtC) family protein